MPASARSAPSDQCEPQELNPYRCGSCRKRLPASAFYRGHTDQCSRCRGRWARLFKEASKQNKSAELSIWKRDNYNSHPVIFHLFFDDKGCKRPGRFSFDIFFDLYPTFHVDLVQRLHEMEQQQQQELPPIQEVEQQQQEQQQQQQQEPYLTARERRRALACSDTV